MNIRVRLIHFLIRERDSRIQNHAQGMESPV
jgi:hypothetical protein